MNAKEKIEQGRLGYLPANKHTATPAPPRGANTRFPVDIKLNTFSRLEKCAGRRLMTSLHIAHGLAVADPESSNYGTYQLWHNNE